MHQPWASLLVYGIKRIEGRSWPAPIRGRLWIHAAGKVPEPETIKAMEDFYREIYAMNGVTDLKFPEHYPVSRLLGCVDVVGCVTCEELVSWEDIPASIYEAAVRGLSSVKAPQPVKFPLPDPRDPFSLKPGSLASRSNCSSLSQEEKSPSLVAAIAGARAAATQFSKNNTFQPPTGDSIEGNEKPASSTIHHSDAS
ncbi:hypothetical protein DH2020_019818 [Rehmannia glutinosa]|uniref:ASCH domain-containing protein n=1 Tax=Rehmannia glutinosa TaxID=99300 RepID=A0ABR0WHY3_REHGL